MIFQRTLLLAILAGGVAIAQEELQRNTAHVKVYPEVERLVQRASTLAAEGRYGEAAEIYEEAVGRHPDTVVPADGTRARGVRDYVLERIAAWPEEGRAACRRLADPRAEEIFRRAAAARDLDALEGLAETYPYSSFAGDALALAARLGFDAGEAGRASEALARLVNLGGERASPAASAQLGLAYAQAGRKALLEKVILLAEERHPGAKVLVGGGERGLAEYLRSLSARTREGGPPPPPLAIPGWEMIGGGPGGWTVADPGIVVPPPAWRVTIDLPRFDFRPGLGLPRAAMGELSPDFRPLFPAVSNGILYVHNGSTLFAFNLYARKPEILWQFRVPLSDVELNADERVIYAVTVHEGAVYANLVASATDSEKQLGYVMVKHSFPRRGLFALDAFTGKRLWSLGGDAAGEGLETGATFAAPPTPEGRRLYVGAVKQRRSTDLFEHYVLCLDAGTGRILWSTFVASGGTEINLFGNSIRESLGTPVSLDEASVFYATNHGVIAALEKKTGRLRWTYRYRQFPVNPTRSVHVDPNPLGWVNGPPLVAAGAIVVAPTDSPFLYAIEARTGELVWERPRTPSLRTLYGIRGGTVVAGGDDLEFYDLHSGDLTASAGGMLAGTGRGVVAEDGVIVPGRDKFRRVGWDGRWNEPAASLWPDLSGEGGNLLAVDGAVVLAAQDSVQVFFDGRDRGGEILAELAKDPDDVGLLYRAALRTLQSGDVGTASVLLRRVAERTASSSLPEVRRVHRAARKRSFFLSMELGRAALDAGELGPASRRFGEAREAAMEVSERIEAALMVGRVCLASGDTSRAIKTYLDLLSEHGDAVVEDRRVFDVTRGAIRDILQATGRAAYAPYEAAARNLLDSARREGTPEGFRKVFLSFPNSLAAEEGLFESAARLEGRGREGERIAALREFLREFGASPLAPEASARIVRALEEKGHVVSAAARLRRMRRAFPEAEVKEGDGSVKVRDFVAGRLESGAYARLGEEAVLPRLAVPLRKILEYQEKEHPEAVPLEVKGISPDDLLLLGSEAGVGALDVGSGKETWRLGGFHPVDYAAFFEESLLLANGRRVVRLGLRDGRVQWEHAASHAMQGFSRVGAFLCFISTDGTLETLRALDLESGAEAWSRAVEGTASWEVQGAGDAVVLVTSAPNRITLFEEDTGRTLGDPIPTSPGVSARVLSVTADGVLLHVPGRFVEAFDLPGGALRWRVPLEPLAARSAVVCEAGMVLLGRRAGVPRAVSLGVVDLRSGKLVGLKEDLDVGDPVLFSVEGRMAHLVARVADRSLVVHAIRLDDLSVAWSAPVAGPDSVPLPLLQTRDHLVAGAFEGGRGGRFIGRAVLLDRSGRGVQNIGGDAGFESPPRLTVSGTRVVFGADGKMDVYR